ncbi:MAG: hypothetical protein IH987_16910, partial [Planctomycetes bacterium]|nr:hypothetical protein [Planctomycetota bacterium]
MGLNRASLAAAVFSTAIASISYAELIGVGDNLSSPVIVFDSRGTTTYDAASDLFSVDAAPIAIRFTPADRPRTINPTGDPPMENVSINIFVDENGDLIGGVPGDDLIVIGEVDSDGDG